MSSPSGAHWRDTARPVRFFILDYRTTFPVLILLYFPSWTVLCITVLVLGFFALLERWGFTLSVFGRYTRSLLSGSEKVALPWWMKP